MKIRYARLADGQNVAVRCEGTKTIIYLRPALTREQRKAAILTARRTVRVGRGSVLTAASLALADAVDRAKTKVKSAVAAMRIHPTAVAVPSVVVVTAVVLVTFIASILVRVLPPKVFGSGSPPLGIEPGSSQRAHSRPPARAVATAPPWRLISQSQNVTGSGHHVSSPPPCAGTAPVGSPNPAPGGPAPGGPAPGGPRPADRARRTRAWRTGG